jgi:hypothetical protein
MDGEVGVQGLCACRNLLPKYFQFSFESLGWGELCCHCAGNVGLRDPRSIVQGRNVLFSMFGGKVPLRPGTLKPGERPFLIARVGLNRSVLLQAAACRRLSRKW